MKFRQLLMIPDYGQMEESIHLAEQYQAGFEYNDFFLPSFMDRKEKVEEKIRGYLQQKETGRLPAYCTCHGAFLDVTIFSDDPKIVQISDERIRQSLNTAKRLSAKGIVFHTNYIVNFLQDSYRNNWMSRNETYWRRICKEYPEIQIYMENMFDTEPVLLARLAERMADVPNFGVCFDYAHAQVFGDEKQIEDWVKMLAPYVKHLHINDNDLQSDLHLPLGEGKIDWKQFREFYETYFSDASVLIEVTGLERAKKSLQFLEKL